MTDSKKAFLANHQMIDPFCGFAEKESATLWGWNGDLPIFNELITGMRPRLVVEVGSWMGQSSCTMARSMRDNGLDSVLVCIDTWLGSIEHWSTPYERMNLDLRNGCPTIYESFMTNVIREGLSGYVVPLPMPSTIGCVFLDGSTADLVYIDGSHAYRDVLRDLGDYWPLVNPAGGILFGDDWAWDSVRNAVTEFSLRINVEPRLAGCHWILQKGPAS